MSSSSIYGGTYNLFKYTLAKLGIEVTFVENQDDPEEWRAAVRPNTKLFFAETIGNPKINVLDIRIVADVAHENGIPLIVDNTIATPYLIRPFEHGADIVVHSATKFLGGHGTVIGGVIVDGGTFEWSKNVDKFPGLTVPDPSYHGASYTAAVGDGLAYIIKARVQLLRDLGAAISPQSAWLLIQGIETLSLRIERHVQNAQEIAEWLENHADVASVNYSGLPTSPWYAAANNYAPKGVGAVLSFELKGGVEAGPRVRQLADPVQPPRQHRRRALARHPPRLDDALAAHARAAAHHRRHAGPRAPVARPREHRRPQGRPRAGARRRASRLGGRSRLSLTHPVQADASASVEAPDHLVWSGASSWQLTRPEPRQCRHGAVTRRPRHRQARENGRMDWQTSEDTVPSAPVTEADARLLLGRPPATGAWRDGDPVGDRHFAAFGAFRTEGGRELPGLPPRVRDVG